MQITALPEDGQEAGATVGRRLTKGHEKARRSDEYAHFKKNGYIYLQISVISC